jgi:hypothetical protein
MQDMALNARTTWIFAHLDFGPPGFRPTWISAHLDFGPPGVRPTWSSAHLDFGPLGVRPTWISAHSVLIRAKKKEKGNSQCQKGNWSDQKGDCLFGLTFFRFAFLITKVPQAFSFGKRSKRPSRYVPGFPRSLHAS